MREYKVQSDLACEAEVSHEKGKSGTDFTEKTESGFTVASLVVENERGEQATGKKKGRYVTIFSDMICDIPDEKFVGDIFYERTV